MHRYILAAVCIILVSLAGATIFSSLNRPSEMDYRLARGRAFLEAENYLGALETLRELPQVQNSSPETHSYIGAAYLRLHLYQAALAEFEQAARLHPRQADPWIGLASTYIQLGEAAKAVQEANQATRVQKESADAWITLGRAQWQDHNFGEAEKAALKARSLDPENPATSDLLLHVYFDQNQPEKFQAELDRNPEPQPGAQDLAVQFFLRQGQFERAYDRKARYERPQLDRSILETELALHREPARTELHAQLIKDLVRAGRFAEAIDSANTYHGSIPLDLDLGKSYWMTGRKDDAIQAYRRASSALVHKLSAEVALAAITGDIAHWKEAFRSERPEQDYFILAMLEDMLPKANAITRAFIYRYAGIFNSWFYNKAAEEALQVLNSNPEDFDALMTIGTAYQRLGRIEDATRYAERAREAYPKSAEPLSRLANLTLATEVKNPQEVMRLMTEAVNLEPNNAGYLYNLGWFYDQTGDTAKAADLYRRAIRISSLSLEAMNNLALIYGSAGEPGRSLLLLEQAIRTDPENEAGYFNIANYHVRQRDWKSALQNYEQILRIDPANSAAAIEKAKIYLEIGRTESAIESLNNALEIDAHSLDAYSLLSSAYEKMGNTKEASAAAEEAKRIRLRTDSKR